MKAPVKLEPGAISSDQYNSTVSGVGNTAVYCYRIGNIVTVIFEVITNAAISVGNHYLDITVAEKYRPNRTAVYACISRADSGTQGMGTFRVQSNGQVHLGTNTQGVSGVVMGCTITFITTN